MLVSILNLVVTVGGGAGIASAPISKWWAFVPLGILLLVVAPYKLWKRKRDQLIELTNKKLIVELEKNPEVAQPGYFLHLIVRNPNSKPIKNCYGQLKSFEPNRNNRPYSTLGLPWSHRTTREMERYTIPSNANGLLDFIVTDRKVISIFTLSPEEGKREYYYPEPPGIYRVEVRVGSETESFAPTEISVEIKLDKSGNFQSREIKQNERGKTSLE